MPGYDATGGPTGREVRARSREAPWRKPGRERAIYIDGIPGKAGRGFMVFDDQVAERVRSALAGAPDLSERRMFGGIAFMVRGNMCCGVIGDRLMLRVGPKGYEAALLRPHAKPMDFTGRPMKGLVYVEPAGFASPLDLKTWIDRALEFALSLPPK